MAEAVSALVEGVFDSLAPLVTQADALFAGAGEAGVRAADLDRLRPGVLRILAGPRGLVVGAGCITAPHALADQELGFEWWTRTSDAAPSRLCVSLDPASDHFLDYTRQSWFTVPRDTGRRHITGPYVDYLCTDEYTMTFTVPVRPGGRFAGVVGADVFVRELEHVLRPRLRGLPGRAALVNAQGRVVVSNSARQATGSLVRAIDIPAWWSGGAEPMVTDGVTLRRCGDAPIALLVSP
ncbi:cache domain-containing protein [Prauserella shujinwangii]|nr:cache domain-containing protein [Prauserella shujinwangii]